MKTFIKLTFTLLLVTVISKTANAQRTPFQVCFSDGFGYVWKFSNITMTSATSYYAEGTVLNAYSSGKATLWVDLSGGANNAAVEVHGVNLIPDGCTFSSDSFVYVGSANITHGVGYTGSGSWTSYCSGGIINAGTWEASGPCGVALAPKASPSAVKPANAANVSGKKSSNGTAAVAPLTVCFSDGFGYVWKFSNITMTSATSYYAEGTVLNAYSNGAATLWVDVSGGASNASVEVHGVNLNPDGCTFSSDSFVYVGSADITHGVGYTGSGTWNSYCSGGVINAGTWDAAGPCGGGGLQPKKNSNGPLPAKAGGNNLKNALIAVPNPVKNNTQLKYTVSSSSAVNITIYNYMHQPVKVLVNESKTAGNYSVNWNALNSSGNRVNTGLYQVVMTSGNKMFTTTLQVL